MPARRKKLTAPKPENHSQLFWLGLIAIILGIIGVRGVRSAGHAPSELSRDPAQALIAPSGVPR